VSERVVLVTGGTGFVGSAVVHRLRQGKGEVHLFGRMPDTAARGPVSVEHGIRWHPGDLEDAVSVRRALEQASDSARGLGVPLDVIHCAARISYRKQDADLLQRTNLEGTRSVLAACRATGVRRLCHVSSVVALGRVDDPTSSLDDDAPLGGARLESAYARTKAAAEDLVLAARDELDVVVASPAVVFGPGERGSNSLHFLGRVVRGTLGPLSPPGSLSVVGLADTADGIVLALDRGVRARRYLLCESTWKLHSLLKLASNLVGRAGPRMCLPQTAWRAFVATYRWVDRLFPMTRATPEALELLGFHFRFQARRAREELGWSPRPFAQVLAETLAWIRGRETEKP